jgi:hypothetical protein
VHLHVLGNTVLDEALLVLVLVLVLVLGPRYLAGL